MTYLKPIKKAKRTDDDAEEGIHPLRLMNLKFDRARYAEARARGVPRREAMIYARNEGVANLDHMAVILEEEPAVRRDIVARLEEKQHLLLDYIDDEIVAGADLSKLATAFAAITDRLRLYQGKATAINENRTSLSDVEKKKIMKILNSIRPTVVYDVDTKPQAASDGPDDTKSNGPDALPATEPDAGSAEGDVGLADGGQGTQEVRL